MNRPAPRGARLAMTLLAGLVLATAGGWMALRWFETPVADARCAHRIDGARCPFCHPELIERDGFCAGHQVPEALCFACRPWLEPAFRARGDWCSGHGVPESQCAPCSAHGCSAAAEARPEDQRPEDQRPEDQRPEHERPDPGRSSVPADRLHAPPEAGCGTGQLVVPPPTVAAAAAMGIRVAPATVDRLVETVSSSAEVVFDAARCARLAPRVAGVVRDVPVDLGTRVEEGDVLVVIDSAELGAAKADLHQASALLGLRKTIHEREDELHRRGISAERVVLEAAARLAESRIARDRAHQRLRLLGLSEEAVAEVERSGGSSALLEVRAPFAGEVVELTAVRGEVVSTERTIVAIADTSRMWAWLDVPAPDVTRVALGQAVRLTLRGGDDEGIAGSVTWVGPEVDRRTRTVRVRAEVPNPDGRLRANSFAHAEISVREVEEAVLVPSSAVQWEGCCNVVFVRREDGSFGTRQVWIGARAPGGLLEVREGLRAGEPVAVEGSFLLKSGILAGRIGAACCADPAEGRGEGS